MVKKLIISLFIIISIILGIKRIRDSKKTIECWWSVLYPTFSYAQIEDEQNYESKISSTNPHYIYLQEKEEEPIKIKFAIVEWFKKIFKKEVD